MLKQKRSRLKKIIKIKMNLEKQEKKSQLEFIDGLVSNRIL